MQLESLPGRCNAKTRSGGYCTNWPVQGKKRCRMHGAFAGRPVVTGRYSRVLRESLQTKYRQFLQDNDYRELRCEVAIQRALLSEYLARFRENVALTALDIARLFDWLDKIGRMVERVNRIEVSTALTAREIEFLEVIIVNLLMDYLPKEKRAEFADRLADALGSEGFALPAPQVEVIDAEYPEQRPEWQE